MTKVLRGRVRGRTIEIADEIGFREGQEVEVQVRTVPNSAPEPGDGLLRTEGALEGDMEWDEIMDEIYQSRKVDHRHSSVDFGEP